MGVFAGKYDISKHFKKIENNFSFFYCKFNINMQLGSWEIYFVFARSFFVITSQKLLCIFGGITIKNNLSKYK